MMMMCQRMSEQDAVVHREQGSIMQRLRLTKSLGLLVALLAVLGGCDRGTTPTDDAQTHQHAAIAVTTWTDKTEVFFEYPP